MIRGYSLNLIKDENLCLIEPVEQFRNFMKNRILVLSNSLVGGGAEAVARLMVENIKNASCVLFENDADIHLAGHRIYVMTQFSSKTLFFRLIANLWRVVHIQCHKAAIRPLVTISHLEGPNLANLLTLFGGRRVIFVHNRVSRNYQKNTATNRLIKCLVRWLYRRADQICCVSSDIQTDLIRHFDASPDQLSVLPNPINTGKIGRQSCRSYNDVREVLLEESYLISLASLTAQKNHELLLNVYSKLSKEGAVSSTPKLFLLGDGDQKARLKAVCQDLNLSVTDWQQSSPVREAQVHFLGFQTNPYPFLRNAKLLLMTSRWEGLPIALLEAMSLGVPAVVSDCSEAIRDVWQVNGSTPTAVSACSLQWTPYGALVNNSTSSDRLLGSWVSAIKHLLADASLYQRSRKLCVKRATEYDITQVSRIWAREILKKNGLEDADL